MRLSVKNLAGLIAVIAIALIFQINVNTQAQSFGPHYTEWSAPEPIPNISLPGVHETPTCISHDGLRLYFNRSGDIYISHRPSRDAEWGAAVVLPALNTQSYAETGAFESTDGHWLYFSSNRPGGLGTHDIWVSYRSHVHDDAAWEEPVNLSAVNSVGYDSGPMLFEDETTGITQLYFHASPFLGGTQAVMDIYVSTLGPNGFEAPVPETELNAVNHLDGKPNVRRDGLEMIFMSFRVSPLPWAAPGYIYVSTRSSMEQPWSAPTVAIGTANPGSPGDRWVTSPALSRDAAMLIVSVNELNSDNSGDLYVSYRTKIRGPR